MPRRKKSNPVRLWFALLIPLGLLLCATPSYAQQLIETQPDGRFAICPDYQGFTNKIVRCIGETIVSSMQLFLEDYNTLFITTVNILCMLAVILYGILLLTGRAQPAVREGVMLAIKIGAVVFLINWNAFSILFPFLLDTIDFMTSIVHFYASARMGQYCPNAELIWNKVDCVLNHLIGGILPGTALFSGIIGLLFASIFSGGAGIALFMLGLAIVLVLLRAFMMAVFILLSAYLAMALLAMLAPVVIPLILFRATKGYFDKWIRLIIGVILQPVFLYAFLNMFVLGLDITLFDGRYSLYRTLACSFADQQNFSIGHYMNGAYTGGRPMYAQSAPRDSLAAFSVMQKPTEFAREIIAPDGVADNGISGQRAFWGATNVFDPRSTLAVFIPTQVLDFPQMAVNCNWCPVGAAGNQLEQCQLNYFITVIFSFFSAVAVIYIFYTMLLFVPYLGTVVSSDLFGLPNLGQLLMPKDSLSMHSVSNILGIKSKPKGGG